MTKAVSNRNISFVKADPPLTNSYQIHLFVALINMKVKGMFSFTSNQVLENPRGQILKEVIEESRVTLEDIGSG